MTKKFAVSMFAAICAMLVAANAVQAQGVPRNSKLFIRLLHNWRFPMVAFLGVVFYLVYCLWPTQIMGEPLSPVSGKVIENPVLQEVLESSGMSRSERRALETSPQRRRSAYASAISRVPTMANAPGQFGAFFKTRLILLNVTTRSYRVYVNFFGSAGKIKTIYVDVGPREIAGWDNFLEAAGVTGAAAAEFDAWFDPPGGSELNEFLLMSEVYTDSANGRYKTVVQDFGVLDEIGPSFSAFSPGVFVSANSRTNIGCFNRALFGGQTISADLMNATGQLVKTCSFSLVEDGWGQISVSDAVTAGYIVWRPRQSCSCWAVVVDNTSNDGSFIPAREYIP